MKTFLRIIVRLFCWLVALGILFGLVLAVRHVFRTAREQREREAASLTREIIPAVRVCAVGRGDLREEVTVTGNVEAVWEVKVISKLPGRIDELKVEECSPVKKGDVIAVIDHDQIEAEAARARAVVGVAKANIKSADVAVEDAQREKGRMEKLVADGATNQQNVDRAETAFDSAIANRELAQANLKQAEAALDLAEVNLDEATIRSPLDGVVSAKHLDQGNLVGKDDAIVTIMDISSVKIIADVSERYLGKLRAGAMPAEVSIDSLPGESFVGKVHKIYPALDRNTRCARVEIRAENPKRRLLPGMYARVKLILEERKNVVTAPVSAMMSRPEGFTAFVVNSETVKAAPVELGIRSGGRAEVLSGLREGDRLVVEGQSHLKDGVKVQIIPAEEAE